MDAVGLVAGWIDAERDREGRRPGDGPDVPFAAASLAAFNRFMRLPGFEALEDVDNAVLACRGLGGGGTENRFGGGADARGIWWAEDDADVED